MNMITTLANAFGVDGERLQAAVAAHEEPDRLALVEARWRERGCPDGDFAWLLNECKRLRLLAADPLGVLDAPPA